jgi:hypothetical protein
LGGIEGIEAIDDGFESTHGIVTALHTRFVAAVVDDRDGQGVSPKDLHLPVQPLDDRRLSRPIPGEEVRLHVIGLNANHVVRGDHVLKGLAGVCVGTFINLRDPLRFSSMLFWHRARFIQAAHLCGFV